MDYHFTTNSRVISDLLANYKNTFLAFCELINNSIQANATKINIDIDQIGGSLLERTVIKQITIRDNGVGVAQSDFEKKIFEIGTDVKPKGKGVGRFAAFQIGAFLDIETVAYDPLKKKKIKTIFPINGADIEKSNLEGIKFTADHKEVDEKADTYYQVKICEFYDEAITQQDKAKRLHKDLIKENIKEAIFLQYPIQILNDEIAFFINGIKIDKNAFVIGGIEKRKENYVDLEGTTHEMELSFINYSAASRDIQVFLRVDNDKIKNVGYKFRYALDIPDSNGWLVYIDSRLFDENQDIFRNLLIPGMRKDAEHLIDNLKGFIDKFFNEKYKDYFNFSKTLREDPFYPYRVRDASSASKSIAFNQIAFFIEKEHKILADKRKIRKIIYPLVDKAINHGALIPIVTEVLSLKGNQIEKFNELLDRTNLEDVIQFSEEVARKNQFLDFLNNIIYEAPAKRVKERSQLHKVIEKNLWIFGEQYNDTPTLFSDKSLKNNLIELRKTFFDYDPSKEADNLLELEDSSLKDITDLFFFNEKILDDNRREILVVELKRPSCKISMKELNQLDKYRFDIEDTGKFSQDVFFKIILISSDFNKYARATLGTADPKNPYLHLRNKPGNIETWVIKWSDLIHNNRKKLSYLGNALKTKDQNVKDVFEKEFSDIDISNLFSEMTAAN